MLQPNANIGFDVAFTSNYLYIPNGNGNSNISSNPDTIQEISELVVVHIMGVMIYQKIHLLLVELLLLMLKQSSSSL